MQEIYADAEEVIVWLGPSTSTSSLAIYFVEKIYEVFENLEVNKWYDNNFRTMNSEIRDVLLASISVREKIENKLQALSELISKAWWDRIVRLIGSCLPLLIQFACLQVTCSQLIPRAAKMQPVFLSFNPESFWYKNI